MTEDTTPLSRKERTSDRLATIGGYLVALAGLTAVLCFVDPYQWLG